MAILSAALTRELFRTPADAIGAFVKLNGRPYQIIGVGPPDLNGMFGSTADAWVPPAALLEFVVNDPAGQPDASDVWKKIALFYGVAASDLTSSSQLADENDRRLKAHHNAEAPLHASIGLTTDPLREVRVRGFLRLALLLILVFTAVSTLNYALLLLARTPRYIEDIRLKRALGAGQKRLLAELCIGPGLIAGLSMAFACLICVGTLVLMARVPGPFAGMVQASLHVALLVLTLQVLLASLITTVMALLPAVCTLRDVGAPRSGSTTTLGRRTSLVLQITVTIQIALCAATFVLAGMVVSSLLASMRTPLGYIPKNLSVVRIEQTADEISASGNSKDPDHSGFPNRVAIKALLQQVSELQGVQRVSFTGSVPLEDEAMLPVIAQRLGSTAPRTASQTWVSPGFFQTMGTQIIRGRDLSASALSGGNTKVVLNELLASELWPGENPIGKSMKLIHPAASGLPASVEYEAVVGVVENMRHAGLTDSPQPTIYFSCMGGGFFDTGPRLVVRGTESMKSLQALASHEVPNLMPGLDAVEVYSVQARTNSALLPEEKRACFVLGGALIMALLSSFGLYGSLSYYVASRRRDIAVRICFGASASKIHLLILRQAWLCAGPAMAISLPLWLILARFSSEDLLGPLSWSTGRATWITLACIALSMCVSLLPASTAVSLSPSEILKEQ